MNTREQFGKYLLLKKLTEDPLGETFRAGLLGQQGMERVALLRIFNGQGLDGKRLWQAVDGRSDVQQALKSPNIGDGIEMGQIEGIPFVAYDYVSGKNMANLLEQAAKKRNFIPAEHALLITERIALGLASAAETRLGNDRIHHGFLVPHLIVISNEGETRLLGFEVGQGLRSFAQNPVIRQHFGRYLAPEALAGAAPDKIDDIYSLGVILFELLTGRPLPPPAPDGFASVIDQGVVATEASPVAPELAALLKQSLVPRDHRIKDIVTWHKTLNKYMFEGQYNPTTFNLAFFMHNLFRQEIERESQEIEVEKTLPVPTVTEKAVAPVAVAAAPAVADPSGSAVALAPSPASAAGYESESTDTIVPPAAAGEKKGSKTGLILGIIAALLGLAAGAYFFLGGDKVEEPPVVAAAPVPVEPVEPEYTGPTEDEIKAQIEELVGQQSSLLQQQYDDQLESLQKQLADAEKEKAERRQREAERKAQAEADAEAARLAEEAEAAAEVDRIAEQERQAEADRIAAEEAAAIKLAEEQKAAATPEPAKPAPAPPKPAAPQVRRGDLVEMGPSVTPPVATRPVQPRYPEMARRFNKKNATVVVKVLIDETGEVVKAEISGQPQKFGFDTEAIEAAKRSKWKPATKGGVPVKMWHTLAIKFRQ